MEELDEIGEPEEELEQLGDPPKKMKTESDEEKKVVGRVSHYLDKIGVAIVELSGGLRVGDKISIEGSITDFQQTIRSMQIEHKNVQQCKAKDVIGLKTDEPVRKGDTVYKLS